jgi:hypothetical protein
MYDAPAAARGEIVEKILQLLSDGPMTSAEMCSSLKLDRHIVGAVLHRMRNSSSRMPKRIRIIGFAFDEPGQRRYPRAIYEIGGGVDTEKPRRQTNAKSCKTYRLRKKTIVNSVFALGTPSSQRVAASTLLKLVSRSRNTKVNAMNDCTSSLSLAA